MIDQKIFIAINGLAGKSGLMDFLGIFFAEYLGYFLIIAAAVLFFFLDDRKKRLYYFAFTALTVILSRGIFTELIRFFYHRPRPFLILGIEPLIEQINKGALPSGHAALYFALALPILFINRKWGWYMVSATGIMGLARVFVGVHWPFDIAAGAAIAALSFYLVKILLNNYKP
jgi:undecaprenyl-diphosphatase